MSDVRPDGDDLADRITPDDAGFAFGSPEAADGVLPVRGVKAKGEGAGLEGRGGGKGGEGELERNGGGFPRGGREVLGSR